MSVVGIDIGNACCVVAAAGKGGVDVVLNEESKRETPTCVAIGERQRFLGAAGASPTPGTIAVSQIKRLIGRLKGDENLDRDLRTLFPNLNVSWELGFPLIHFKYCNREAKLSPTQLLGMLLGSLKRSAERHLSTPVSDCCIAVPAHFNNAQRWAVLHAAEIAGLRPLRLLHECSAAALEYGIYRRDFPVEPRARPHIAAIVDIGHSAAQVAITEFRAGEARILARAADPNLGGRDFDGVLYDHFVAKLIAKDPDLDVSKSVRASTRLRASCEKVKKVLSANPEATLNIECFMEDKDVSELITREEFEQLCESLLERLKRPLRKALSEAGLKPEEVEAVELIGSGSRVPSVVKVVGEVFKQEPRRTLNASECVAKGCALQAAMLSPAFRVKDFTIFEHVPFAIDIVCRGNIRKPADTSVGPPLRQQIITVRNQIPTNQQFMANTKEDTFHFDLMYSDGTPNQLASYVSGCEVDVSNLTETENAQLRINVKLNVNGTISVDSVIRLYNERSHQLEESKEAGVGMDIDKDSSPTEVCSQMPIDADPSRQIETDMNAVKNEEVQDASKTGDFVELAKSEQKNKAVKTRKSLMEHIEEDPSAEANSEVHLPFTQHVYGVFSTEALKEVKRMETQMAAWDKQVEETKDRKNALESYVYEMRNKLRGKYHEFVMETDRKALIERLQQVEKWLYEDGEDADRDTYTSKLGELKALGEPIERRFWESSERGPATELLNRCIRHFWSLAKDNRPQFAHIEKQEKWKVQNACENVHEWLQKKMMKQEQLFKFEDPVVTAAELRSKTEALDSFCKEIMNRSPPPQPKYSLKDRMVRLVQDRFPWSQRDSRPPEEEEEEEEEEKRQFCNRCEHCQKKRQFCKRCDHCQKKLQEEEVQRIHGEARQDQPLHEHGIEKEVPDEGSRDPLQVPHQQSQLYNAKLIRDPSLDPRQPQHAPQQTHSVSVGRCQGHSRLTQVPQPQPQPQPQGRQASGLEHYGGGNHPDAYRGKQPQRGWESSNVGRTDPNFMKPTRQSVASSAIAPERQGSHEKPKPNRSHSQGGVQNRWNAGSMPHSNTQCQVSSQSGEFCEQHNRGRVQQNSRPLNVSPVPEQGNEFSVTVPYQQTRASSAQVAPQPHRSSGSHTGQGQRPDTKGPHDSISQPTVPPRDESPPMYPMNQLVRDSKIFLDNQRQEGMAGDDRGTGAHHPSGSGKTAQERDGKHA